MQLVFLAIVVLSCLGLTTAAYKHGWNKHLNATVTFTQDTVEEGALAEVVEQIENRKLLPLPTFTIKFQMDRSILYQDQENSVRTDKQYRNDCIAVMPYQRVTRRFPVKCTKRGFYNVDKLDLVAQDLRYRCILSEERTNHAALYVMPARSAYRGIQELMNRLYGDCVTRSLLLEDPFSFRGIRDYGQHDPMSRVNWKATARTGELKVNQYFQTSSQQVTIFLDMGGKQMSEQEDLYEESIRLTRSFLEYFMQKGVPVQVKCNGCDLVTGREISLKEGTGSGHLTSCLKQLSRLDPHQISRSMADLLTEEERFLQEQGRNQGESRLSILIAVQESEELVQDFDRYNRGNGSGNWLIPIHESMKRYLEENHREIAGKSSTSRVEYLVMEENRSVAL